MSIDGSQPKAVEKLQHALDQDDKLEKKALHVEIVTFSPIPVKVNYPSLSQQNT